MIRSFMFALCLFVSGLLCLSPPHAQLGIMGVGPGGFGVAASGYTGPGDINGTAYAFWSTRCITTAYTGNVVDIWDGATGSTTQTTITCSSGGTLNTGSPTALATTCAVSCRVKTWYDQSGSTKCSGACDMTQATNANRATLNTSLLNSKIGAVFAGSHCYTAASITAQAQSITFTAVYNATNSATGNLYSDSLSGFQFYVHDGAAANQVDLYAGGVAALTATANDNTTHAVQAFANAGTSAIYVDGSNTSGSLGTIGISSSVPILGSTGNATCASGTQLYTGNLFELGIWAGSKVANNSSMNSNQHTYWSF